LELRVASAPRAVLRAATHPKVESAELELAPAGSSVEQVELAEREAASVALAELGALAALAAASEELAARLVRRRK
jgi:hypothetical protein